MRQFCAILSVVSPSCLYSSQYQQPILKTEEKSRLQEKSMQKREKENAAVDILGENKRRRSLSYGICAHANLWW
ncbi:hypothetical protein BDV27DRAFT_109933 [Aspergillus caelatus]|uniref:Uncharacterized protein n=1 Tax=Aspergillus caelatus TaxID=61420 RepID=A0A5N7A8I6_9EURO|nr:uncharacterized protein BDV27DRAFT_109933 [Aspergillus caelatus]KAE8364870.1 hypothetical protein BDV27DRAFT_109933 [Aspergillus caelatus]